MLYFIVYLFLNEMYFAIEDAVHGVNALLKCPKTVHTLSSQPEKKYYIYHVKIIVHSKNDAH